MINNNFKYFLLKMFGLLVEWIVKIVQGSLYSFYILRVLRIKRIKIQWFKVIMFNSTFLSEKKSAALLILLYSVLKNVTQCHVMFDTWKNTVCQVQFQCNIKNKVLIKTCFEFYTNTKQIIIKYWNFYNYSISTL